MAENKQPGRTIATKYGTKINVEGLTPEQVAKVKSTAQDNGKYGGKGAALAAQLQKQSIKIPKDIRGKPQTGGPLGFTDPGATPQTGGGLMFDPKTGYFDPNNLLAGAPGVMTAPDLQGAVQQAQDANFQFMTKNLERDKTQEMEAAKQDLANRGVPMDPTPGSLWSKTLGSIDEKYQGVKQDAQNQSIALGNQTLSTQAGVQNQARDSFINGALGAGQAAQGFYGMNQDLAFKNRQLDWQAKQSQRDRQLQLQIARMRGSGGGGGGGGDGGSSGPIIGGSPPGFGITNQG